uniref:LAGLIDADG homing endonuclease n=1 Tax=Blastosporella zonata TaxID=530045 RepID=A0A386TXY6_9AGAR|nr:LAGLIDADG homing endonuclease [Blastosporella zonata]AYE93083.1 LAGLIDADG homing endonuclease [Blastosporella zonata]
MIKLMEFLKRTLSSLSSRARASQWNNSLVYKKVINIISYTFLGFIAFLFLCYTLTTLHNPIIEESLATQASLGKEEFSIFKNLNIYLTIFFSIISFAISMYISDNFKLSNNKYIKLLQKFVIINSIFALIALILYLFDINILSTAFADTVGDIDSKPEDKIGEDNIKNKDIIQVTTITEDNKEYYSFKVNKELLEKSIEKSKNILEVTIRKIVPDLGVGAGEGKVASEAIKISADMDSLSGNVLVGGVSATTAPASKLDNDSRNTPSDFEGGFISSALEDTEIPLIIVVNGLSFLNYIEFSLILTLFSVLFRKYLSRRLISLIWSLKNKYTKNNKVEIIKDKDVSLNQTLNALDKYSDIIIVYIFICLIWVKFINVYFSGELAKNIDDFVTVYNHIKNNSFFFLIMPFNNHYKKIKNNFIWYIKNNYFLQKLTKIKRIINFKFYPLNTRSICIFLGLLILSIFFIF